jgi:CheY-like chemotaxis protein
MIKNILLVDDDSDDISFFQEAINEVDSTVNFYSAKSGSSAFELLLHPQTTVPDLIFLDLNMPRMNGWQCLTKFKTDDKLQQIPVVMYSTSAMKTDVQKALGLGAIALYQKPERFEELKQLLKAVITKLA